MAVNHHLMKLEQRMKALAIVDQPLNELQRRIRVLPQELQDLIFDFVLGSFEPGETVTIDEDYQPPKALSINHATRKKLTAQYYSNTKFVINFSGWRNFKTYSTYLWIRSVVCEHLSLVKELRFRHDLITRRQICEELQQHEDWLSQENPAKHIRLLAHVMAHTANGDRKLQWLSRQEIAALP
ncbi:hypothetical protein HII31_06855, partial [Pseudocercospora fuligena]